MKIDRYNKAMSWMARKPDPRTKEEKKEVVADFKRQSEDFWKKKDAEAAKKKPMHILKWIDYNNGDPVKSDQHYAKIEADAKAIYERKNPKAKAVEPTIEHTKIGTVKNFDNPRFKYVGTRAPIKKVVEVKSKPNGKYKIPEMKLDSFDWDLWLRENDKDYITLEDEDKLVSQPSIDESNATFWENFYYDYKRKGGELNFKEFQKLMIDEGDIGDLGAKKRKGIRGILLA